MSFKFFFQFAISFTEVCSSGTAPSVSSINRILRNRAAERAAAEITRNIHLGVSLQAIQLGNAANLAQQNSLDTNASVPNPLINTPVLNHNLNQTLNQNANPNLNILPNNSANAAAAFSQNNFGNLMGLMGNAPNSNPYTNGK